LDSESLLVLTLSGIAIVRTLIAARGAGTLAVWRRLRANSESFRSAKPPFSDSNPVAASKNPAT